MSASQQRLALGLNCEWTWEATESVTLKPSVNVGWLHLFGDRSLGASGAFPNAGDETLRVAVRSANLERDALQAGFGLEADWNNAWSLFLRYALELRRHNTAQTLFLGLRWEF